MVNKFLIFKSTNLLNIIDVEKIMSTYLMKFFFN